MSEQFAQCKRCGQTGNSRPGLRLEEPRTEAVFVGDELAVMYPQMLVCNNCGATQLVHRDSIKVRKPRAGE